MKPSLYFATMLLLIFSFTNLVSASKPRAALQGYSDEIRDAYQTLKYKYDNLISDFDDVARDQASLVQKLEESDRATLLQLQESVGNDKLILLSLGRAIEKIPYGFRHNALNTAHKEKKIFCLVSCSEKTLYKIRKTHPNFFFIRVESGDINPYMYYKHRGHIIRGPLPPLETHRVTKEVNNQRKVILESGGKVRIEQYVSKGRRKG